VTTPPDWYHLHAADVVAGYEARPFEQVHRWLLDRLPDSPALVLDVGAGSGRDAAWFAARGDEVVAVEPAASLRELARQLHPSPSIRWLDDRLPALQACHALGVGFDVILVSAVWMHVAPSDRDRAFRKLVTLLKPGGLLAMTLRHGPDEHDRGMHPVSMAELERLALRHGAQLEHCGRAQDAGGREGVAWDQVVVRLPDDGTGAMPLLRHVIVNDAKSSTYKLGLLRTLCRIADGAAGLAVPIDDEQVEVPFGLVGLTWLRLYRPLLDAGLPQSPDNVGLERLGFAKAAYRRIAALSPQDLRAGMRFDGPMAADVHDAIRDACDTLETMPVHYSTRPDGRQIFTVVRHAPRRRPAGPWSLDAAALWSFGALRVPVNVWRCLARFDAWIEPALVAEWTRLIHRYAARQQKVLPDGVVARALEWTEPVRSVAFSRQRAAELARSGELHCVWTGRRLRDGDAAFDIDHCFPWSIWPCDALWNLMPAHPDVNRRLKRDRVPADESLLRARERIAHWWDAAYRGAGDETVALRFADEARTSLPGLAQADGPIGLDDVFGAMRLQRVRLRFNQQVQEWVG
jgi:SAM-dependent methyltransferase